MQESLGWTEIQKGIVLSSFFVGYLSTQVLGGWLANRIGGRLTLGIALVVVVGLYVVDTFGGRLFIWLADRRTDCAGARGRAA